MPQGLGEICQKHFRAYQTICSFPGCGSPLECRECRNMCLASHGEWLQLKFIEEFDYKLFHQSCRIKIMYMKEEFTENMEGESPEINNLEPTFSEYSEALYLNLICHVSSEQNEEIIKNLDSDKIEPIRKYHLQGSISLQSLASDLIEEREDECLNNQFPGGDIIIQHQTNCKDPPNQYNDLSENEKVNQEDMQYKQECLENSDLQVVHLQEKHEEKLQIKIGLTYNDMQFHPQDEA